MDTLCKKLLWIALALVLGQSVAAQEKVSKTVTKKFALTDAGKLHLENKYGNINFFGWDKDEVSVSIAISVNHKKKENAEDLLKRIKPTFQNNSNYVSISYQIAEKSRSFLAKLLDETPFDFDRSNVQINYTVNLPRKTELKVTNTFGDVIIEDWTGKLRAKVEHGDLWINDNLNNADITMKYGKLRANNISYGCLDLKNSELDMGDSKNLRINSSGTDIEQLTKDVDLTLKIADFRVTKITNAAVDIAIKQESSKINLNINDFPHQFEATIEQGLVRLPKSFKNIDSEILDKGKKLRQIKATYGNGAPGNISINGKKGVVLLKEL